MHKNVKISNAKLTSHQQKVYNALLQHIVQLVNEHPRSVAAVKKQKKINLDWVREKMIVLSGAAGTGKTFVTSKLISKLLEDHEVIATAPTHKAVDVMRENMEENGIYGVTCRTIQSYLGMRLKIDYVTGKDKYISDPGNLPSSYDILIVDECSMVGDQLIKSIETFVHREYVKAVLFVGDFYQIPPFESHTIPAEQLPNQYRLEEVVRQAAGSYIVKMASEIRRSIRDKKYIEPVDLINKYKDSGLGIFYTESEMIDDFSFEEDWYKEDKIIASYTNQVVEHFNQVVREKYWLDHGKQNPQQILPGDKLIFHKPNVDPVSDSVIHYNSSVVSIRSAKKVTSKTLAITYWECEDKHGRPLRIVDRSSEEYYRQTLEKMKSNAKKEKDKDKKRQLWQAYYVLDRAFAKTSYTFASTIHKLQGSTYNTVYVSLADIMGLVNTRKEYALRLLYVAITRASKDLKIYLPETLPHTINASTREELENIFSKIVKQGLLDP